MLVDEASRLDRGEVAATKRTKDKNAVLESEMSAWMLASLQKSQITKTSAGNASIVAGSLSQGHPKAASATMSPAVMEFAKSVAGGTSALGSPQKMLPFQDFYKMFQEFSETHGQSVAPSQPLEDKVTDSIKTLLSADDNKRKSGGTLAVSDKKQVSVRDKPSGDPVASGVPVEAVNIVKQLSDMDPNFEAYLKVTGRDDAQLMKTKASTSSLAKPRRMRKVAPLGTFILLSFCCKYYNLFVSSQRQRSVASEGLERARVEGFPQGVQQPLQGERESSVSRQHCSAAATGRRGG